MMLFHLLPSCVLPENIQTPPMEGFFGLTPHPSLEIPSWLHTIVLVFETLPQGISTDLLWREYVCFLEPHNIPYAFLLWNDILITGESFWFVPICWHFDIVLHRCFFHMHLSHNLSFSPLKKCMMSWLSTFEASTMSCTTNADKYFYFHRYNSQKALDAVLNGRPQQTRHIPFMVTVCFLYFSWTIVLQNYYRTDGKKCRILTWGKKNIEVPNVNFVTHFDIIMSS